MFGMKKRKTKSVIKGVVLWTLLTSVMLVIYGLSIPTQVMSRASLDQSCTLSVSKSWQNNFTIPRLSTKNKSAVCSPKVNIMFMKTHKTASSTLLNILFRFGEKNKLKFAFPNGRNDFFYPSPFLCSQVKDYQPRECFNIVCNHMRFNAQEVAKLLPLDTVYITILRDPADLFESSFHYYHRAVPLTWRISGEDKMTEFLRSPWTYYSPEAYNSFYLRNLLFFDFGFDNNLEADDSFVVRAIQTLSEHFHLILIAEYFEESLVLLKETLCWTIEDLLFFKFNVRQRSQVSRLTPELRAKALNWNGADWRLYQHFNSTFWTRVHTFGEKRMEQEVKELRRRISEMKAICIEGESAVEAKFIQNKNLLPWQPVGESSILGYNMKKDIDPKYRTLCRKMLTPEIQYLSDLGVSLWLTRLWGWLKSAIY
ncbi:galactosylceramide sulfotransferase [Lampris incognitus]|uniref:galactosylceramide sulfotransferase n=1 Tax=Lampris incognitus TaxID=2546036 RepID=UPI0024B5F7D0|nr:galactosylceramide sulfotransferase [Lampris incognitus]